ncbi:MAG: hypothetical protein JRH06_10065 [Deltaproteobacteria bacterium]|nr:hypothetical protein [Deltaproteobacteria bacterium]MBW2137889.1 hypothetical protein [Deltaproteobacteria bacterium]
MFKDPRPKPPLSGLVYGETIYWGTLAGSLIAIIGSVLAFLRPSNVLDPGYVFTAIWEGKSIAEIWEGALGSMPHGHWYISSISKGDALTMFGLALGVFCVIPGMFGSALLLFKEKKTLFAVLAVIGGAITLLSFLGLFKVPA